MECVVLTGKAEIENPKFARGLTRGRMMITEFCTALLQSDQSDLYVYNSEIKQRQLGNQAVPNEALLLAEIGAA